jgi:hypothetical protein
MHLVYLLVEVYASNLIRKVLNRALCAGTYSAEEMRRFLTLCFRRAYAAVFAPPNNKPYWSIRLAGLERENEYQTQAPFIKIERTRIRHEANCELSMGIEPCVSPSCLALSHRGVKCPASSFPSNSVLP